MSDLRTTSHSKASSGVRLGGAGGGGRSTFVFIGIGAAALIVIGVLWAVLSKEPEPVPAAAQVGCQSDAECDGGRFCAAGGCIVLLSSEHRGIWRDDIAAQKAPGKNWQPAAEPGDRFLPESVCPLPERTMPEAKPAKIRVEKEARVVEVGEKGIVEHFQQKVRGSIWVDVIPLLVGEAGEELTDICGTEGAAGVRCRETTGGPVLDVLLKNAVPAEKSVVAGVSFRTASPPVDAEGTATLSVLLAPPRFVGTSRHTAVVFPLGTEIFSISGPAPSRQKLLKGYVLYDFIHGATPSTVTFSYRPPVESVPPAVLVSEPL